MTLLIKNLRLPDQTKADILIDNGVISRIGVSIDGHYDQLLDAGGKFAIPGFYNMHTHAAMTLFGSLTLSKG